jgi:hypothetical protein
MIKAGATKRLWALFALVLLILSSIWTYRYIYKKPYLIPIQIVGATHGSKPYVKVEIEGREYFFVLDLGFFSQGAIDAPCLAEIQNKALKKTATFHGVLGKNYKSKVYEIPELAVGQMKFSSVLLEESNLAFQADATTQPENKCTAEITAGTLGSGLFKETCLCLDLHSFKMAFCDSFETFKSRLKPHNPFSKVPFSFKNGWIEFEMNVAQKTLHCILDTGSTLNHINVPNPDNKPISEFIKTKQSFDSAQVGTMDFGPIVFSQLPINFPVHIDAIIGLDFIANHLIFIDFVNQEIYFSRAAS